MTLARHRTATTVPLHLSLDPAWDLLEAIAFGAALDLQPDELLEELDAAGRVRLVLDEPDGTAIGFVVPSPWTLDPHAGPELFDGPRFAVPLLGLEDASVGEILLAVRGHFSEGEATNDAICLHEGIRLGGEDPEAAATQFQLALEAGQLKAHFALGYTLLGTGRAREAYRHLRRYTELVPFNVWAWDWLARACEALGLQDEARDARRRAEDLGSGET